MDEGSTDLLWSGELVEDSPRKMIRIIGASPAGREPDDGPFGRSELDVESARHATDGRGGQVEEEVTAVSPAIPPNGVDHETATLAEHYREGVVGCCQVGSEVGRELPVPPLAEVVFPRGGAIVRRDRLRAVLSPDGVVHQDVETSPIPTNECGDGESLWGEGSFAKGTGCETRRRSLAAALKADQAGAPSTGLWG